MSTLIEALRREFDRACSEALESVFTYRDGSFWVIRGGPWETRLYIAQRSGRHCYLFTILPWEGTENRTRFYYSVGDENDFTNRVNIIRDGGPVLLARCISDGLASLLGAVGLSTTEDAIREAIARSIMES